MINKDENVDKISLTWLFFNASARYFIPSKLTSLLSRLNVISVCMRWLWWIWNTDVYKYIFTWLKYNALARYLTPSKSISFFARFSVMSVYVMNCKDEYEF